MDTEQTEVVSLERGFEKGGGLPGCRVCLSDRSSYFILITHADALALVPGCPVTPELREELRRGVLAREIGLKSLDLLARRDHSRMELRRKLEKRFLPSGTSPADELPPEERYFIKSSIENALDSLAVKGYLNDRRFAENWVASRLRRRPEGRGALETGLRARGIPREMAGSVLEEAFTAEIEEEALEKAALKLAGKSGMTRDKLISRLLSRGFSYSRIRSWMERQVPGMPETGEDGGEDPEY